MLPNWNTGLQWATLVIKVGGLNFTSDVAYLSESLETLVAALDAFHLNPNQ